MAETIVRDLALLTEKEISKYPDQTAEILEGLIATSLDQSLTELYERIKHGDDEHKKWLKDEIDRFKVDLGIDETNT